MDSRSLLWVNCRSTGRAICGKKRSFANASTASRRYCVNFVELEFIPFLESERDYLWITQTTGTVHSYLYGIAKTNGWANVELKVASSYCGSVFSKPFHFNKTYGSLLDFKSVCPF